MAEGSGVRVVVGIDFGTTFSGFAFAHKNAPDDIYTFYEWPARQGKPYCKTQTGLFYMVKKAASGSSSKAEYELADWGWQALARQLKQMDGPAAGGGGIHVTKFKLLLAPQEARDAALARMLAEFQMTSAGGEEKHAFGVAEAETEAEEACLPEGLSVGRATADFLKEISTFALDRVRAEYGSDITASDVQWCLTVPAIWDDSAKQIMRTCAEMGGLVAGPSCPPRLAETASPHPVRIVLESEAASAYCAKSKSAELKLERGDAFMVADIGGGTTDIVVHTKANDGHEDLKLREQQQSSGDLCGGTHVDANFYHFLRTKIGCFDEVVSRNHGIMTTLQNRWSDMKTNFDGSEDWGPLSLELPGALRRAWESCAEEGSGDCNYEEIEFTTSDMKHIFDPVVDRIIELIRQAITGTQPLKLLLLLVGGFSASPYLRDRVKAAFADTLRDKIVMPSDPGSAVCKGAVHFGFSPDLVISRVARKTYGIEQWVVFDSKRDPESLRVRVGSVWKCKDRFHVFVRKGRDVGVDQSVSVSSYPVYADQARVGLRIFSTDAIDIRHITEPGVVLEGQFEMDISHDPEKLGLDREIKISMFFGKSCISVQAKRENFGDTQEIIQMPCTLEL